MKNVLWIAGLLLLASFQLLGCNSNTGNAVMDAPEQTAEVQETPPAAEAQEDTTPDMDRNIALANVERTYEDEPVDLTRALLNMQQPAAGTTRGTVNLRGRSIINDTTTTPARFVGYIWSFWPDGSNTMGSGFVVGSRYVLTCGHNIYHRAKGGWAKAIAYSPAVNGKIFPFGVSSVTASNVAGAWYQKGDKEFDVGVVRLKDAVGNKSGIIALEPWSYKANDSRAAAMNGYDGDIYLATNGLRQVTRSGHASSLTTVFGKSTRFTADWYSHGGASGGMVWRVAYRQCVAIGINTDGNSLTGRSQGVRILPEIIDWVNAFKKRNP